MAEEPGRLFLVPTPIGHKGDMTERALSVLRDVHLVACEDTRRSGRFLKQLGLNKKLLSYHDFNEATRSRQILKLLREGKSIAVVTDAGSPGISDPAYRVVRTAIDHDIEVIPLPGANAVIPALTASGLPTDRFFFEGFLPPKGGARRTRLKDLSLLPHTLVFFESPHRVAKTLADMEAVLGDRSACLAREISKLHEQFMRGSLSAIHEAVENKRVRGEIVLVVAGFKKRRVGRES